MADKQICIAIYPNQPLADEAVARLTEEGFGMECLSVVGRDYWADMAGSRHSWGWRGEGGFRYGGNLGSFWERLWAKIPGGGVFCFFENGPMLVAGLLSRTIMAKQDAGDWNPIGERRSNDFEAALSGIGIPEKDVAEYQKSLINNQILLFVFGTAIEVDHAQFLLNETEAINHTIHHTDAGYAAVADPSGQDDKPDLKAA